MIPVPQYPLYLASVGLFNGTAVPYLLDESDSWSMPIEELEKSLKEARKLKVEVVVSTCLFASVCFLYYYILCIFGYVHVYGLFGIADQQNHEPSDENIQYAFE